MITDQVTQSINHDVGSMPGLEFCWGGASH